MKEDILEQLVDDYLQTEGYFTRHNLKFKPDPGIRISIEIRTPITAT